MQTIRFDFNPMMAEYVGEHGIARAEMETLFDAMRDAHAMVEAGRGKGMQGWMTLPIRPGRGPFRHREDGRARAR